MSMVLETHQLTKAFGSKLAVDHVDMHIPKGEIYGFIGMNGAGKTTLMRLILQLALPTSGSFELFGAKPTPESGRRIGSLVENPGFYKNCTARENLVRFSLLYGADPSESDRILQQIGLVEAAHKKAGKFSLGMKQRLGIGIALIGHPEFIVLDEPVNGLDPTGIMEMRTLIQRLNREEGTTFLISSHLLDELGKIATCFGIINRGRLVEEVTMNELKRYTHERIRFVVDEPEKGMAALAPLVGAEQIERKDFALLVRAESGRAPELNRALVLAGVNVNSIGHQSDGLEGYFLERIGG